MESVRGIDDLRDVTLAQRVAGDEGSNRGVHVNQIVTLLFDEFADGPRGLYKVLRS
jgi:hypothetical protein